LEDINGFRGAIYAGAANGAISSALMELIDCGGSIETHLGSFRGKRVGPFAGVSPEESICLVPAPHSSEQRNASVVLGNVYVLKIYRRLNPPPSPDVEAVRFLFERAGFNNVAPATGLVEYVRQDGTSMVAAVSHTYATNRGDLFKHSLDEFSLFLKSAASRRPPPSPRAFRDNAKQNCGADNVDPRLQGYCEIASMLGKRTAQMHLALSSGVDDPQFAPERCDAFYLRGLAHSLDGQARLAMQALLGYRKLLRGRNRELASSALELEEEIRRICAEIVNLQDTGMRTRIHGDLHLAQVLHTGDDVVFIDFEGDNSRSLAERVLKRSPLVDVAGILISLRYAVERGAMISGAESQVWRRRSAKLEEWKQIWHTTAAEAFLSSYRATVGDDPIIPRREQDFQRMLDILLVSKAVYDIGYEIDNRPDWLPIALRTLLEVWKRVRTGLSPQPD
jgi:maltose alpha-D-glucosyltransferase/alpha-amylase